jgi:hypothetical protein
MFPIDIETIGRMNRGDVPANRGRLRMQGRKWETAHARRDYGSEQTPASDGSLPAGANLSWHYQ